jgi:D-isomer specific 2-hydroxyacid dehydrogenase, NAD binding domain
VLSFSRNSAGWTAWSTRTFPSQSPRPVMHAPGRVGRSRGVSGIECVGLVKSCPGGEFPVGAKVAALMGGLGQTAADLGIAVTATGYDSTPTIEFTWSLILASMRGIDRDAASLKAGSWQTRLGSNLRGKSLGVIGLGNIGREVA